jgi:hypothetical protein
MRVILYAFLFAVFSFWVFKLRVLKYERGGGFYYNVKAYYERCGNKLKYFNRENWFNEAKLCKYYMCLIEGSFATD